MNKQNKDVVLNCYILSFKLNGMWKQFNWLEKLSREEQGEIAGGKYLGCTNFFEKEDGPMQSETAGKVLLIQQEKNLLRWKHLFVSLMEQRI